MKMMDFKPVRFCDDHMSEGVLVPLRNGSILLVFRLLLFRRSG